MARRDRCVYAFLSGDGRRVKIGLVNSVTSLAERLRRVAKDCQESDLRMVAYVTVHDIDGHEVEDVKRQSASGSQGHGPSFTPDELTGCTYPTDTRTGTQLLHDAAAAVTRVVRAHHYRIAEQRRGTRPELPFFARLPSRVSDRTASCDIR